VPDLDKRPAIFLISSDEFYWILDED
jgi:hypothetical protein